MIGIDPYTGKTANGLEQLILRVDRLIRTPTGTRKKMRGYGSIIRRYIGKPNSAVVLTSLQNKMLTELSNPINGLTDFTCTQCKVMPNGLIYIIGRLNNEKVEFSI